jgi:type II secretory pathway pseudopilin PulG
MRNFVIIAAAVAIGASAPSFAQEAQVRELNDNVTKVELNAGSARGRGMANPAQTKARAQIPGRSKVQVHAKNDPTSAIPNPADLDIEARRLNDNVSKVDGTVGDFRVRGITTPGTTNVTVQDPGQIKVQVQTKPPKN